MRKTTLLSLCVLSLLLLPSRDAGAFWKYLGELSGPGPFVGLDFVFPWSLSQPNLTVPLNNQNIDPLRRLGVDTAILSTSFEEFIGNREHQVLLERELGISLTLLSAAAPDRKGFVDAFIEATTLKSREGDDYSLLRSFLRGTEVEAFVKTQGDGLESERLALLNEALVRLFTERLRHNISRFGASPAGLFNGQLMIPQIQLASGDDRDKQINNLFFSFSLGVAVAVDNNIPHPRDFDGDKDVVWLSAYPALEWRFLPFDGGKGNVFANVGPAFHYFSGAQFEDFGNVSLRWRVGVQYWRVYAGAEFNVFANALRNDQFGGVSEATDLDRLTTGVFISLDLSRHPKPPRRPGD